MPQNTGPTWIGESSVTGLGTYGYNGSSISQPWLFKVGAALYTMQNSRAGSGIEMFKSVDGGNTWTRMDQAGEPAAQQNPSSVAPRTMWGQGVPLLNGTLITCVFLHSISFNLCFADFDTTTDTWGGIRNQAAIPIQNGNVFFACQFSGGNIGVLYYDTNPHKPFPTARVRGAIFNGAVWSSAFAIDNLLPAGDLPGALPVVPVYNPVTDLIHVCLQDTFTNEIFYETISSAGAIASQQDTGFAINSTVGNSIIYTGKLILSCQDVSGSLSITGYGLLVKDLTSGVWSAITLNAAFQAAAGRNLDVAPFLVTDGSGKVIVSILAYTDATSAVFFFIAASYDAGVTFTIPAGFITAPFFYYYKAGQSPLPVNADPTFSAGPDNLIKLESYTTATQLAVFGVVNMANITNAPNDNYISLLINSAMIPLVSGPGKLKFVALEPHTIVLPDPRACKIKSKVAEIEQPKKEC